MVLLAAVMHALWNFVVKTIPGGLSFVWLGALVVSAWMLPVLAVWLYVFPVVWTWQLIGCLIISSLLHMVYFAVLQRGYQVADLSVVYPVARGSAPVLSSLAAILFFAERPSLVAYAGLACIALGILLIAKPKSSPTDPTKLQLGLWYGFSTGVLIALYTIWDRYLVHTLLIAPLLIEAVSHPLRVLWLWPHARKHGPEIRTIWREHTRKVVFFAIVSPIAFIMILYALKTAPVHFVAPVREISIVLGVILAGKLLAEEHWVERLLGAILMVIGAVCLGCG
jgi:drug/metabolite transporter (DMT)-like permease